MTYIIDSPKVIHLSIQSFVRSFFGFHSFSLAFCVRVFVRLLVRLQFRLLVRLQFRLLVRLQFRLLVRLQVRLLDLSFVHLQVSQSVNQSVKCYVR